jgi:hypothetical protein
MLDYTKTEDILKDNAPEFYKAFKAEHEKGFPVSTENMQTYWLSQLKLFFPEESAFFELSNLNAFTFYAGCEFIRKQTETNGKLSQKDLFTAIELKNYLALKTGITDPEGFGTNSSITELTESKVFLITEMKKYYNTISADIYYLLAMCQRHEKDKNLLDVELHTINEKIATVEQAHTQGWSTNPTYTGLRSFDKQLDGAVQNIIGTLKNYFSTLSPTTQNNQLAQKAENKENEPLPPSPGRPFSS